MPTTLNTVSAPIPPRHWRRRALGGLCLLGVLAGCAEPQIKPSAQHIETPARPAGTPPPLTSTLAAPPPKAAPKVETYSVVVNNVPVRDLLFALARDARVDIDIAGDIEGQVTLNAIEQTLPQLLTRLARQVDLRWELQGKVLSIARDTPYLKNYRIDYVNLKRDTTSTVNVSSQVGGGVAGGSGGSGGGGGQLGNSSSTALVNTSNNHFWETLIQNVKDLLKETDKLLPAGTSEETVEAAGTQSTTGTSVPPPVTTRATTQIAGVANSPIPATLQNNTSVTRRRSTFSEAASVIANPETGIIAVRATARQHEKVQEFLDRILSSSRRQVLIEATIVEVSLNDQSQSGIDWKNIALGSGFSFRQNFLGNALNPARVTSPDMNQVNLISQIMGDGNLSTVQKSSIIEQIAKGMGTYPSIDPGTGAVTTGDLGKGVSQVYPDAFSGGTFPLTGDSRGMTIGFGSGSNFAAAMKLLAQYGRIKVISSPKITALNNQSAILRVVDNLVYFNIGAQTTTSATSTLTTYTSTPSTVAVGFVMSVVPQIDDGNIVTLNVRPTISRLQGYARDPNPALADVPNLVPIVQTREIESIMKIPSGNVVMMGGLMEDREARDSEGLPVLGDLPGIGKLFSTRNSQVRKTELVIFMRPVVITDPSLDGDFRFAKDLVPGKDFFNQAIERPQPQFEPAVAPGFEPEPEGGRS